MNYDYQLLLPVHSAKELLLLPLLPLGEVQD